MTAVVAVHAPWRGMLTAFVTGSHAYGIPTRKSDVDVVVPAAAMLGIQIAGLLGVDVGSTYEDDAAQITYKKLNFIFVNKREWHAWWDATVELMRDKPVVRDYARKVVQAKLAFHCTCEHCEET